MLVIIRPWILGWDIFGKLGQSGGGGGVARQD